MHSAPRNKHLATRTAHRAPRTQHSPECWLFRLFVCFHLFVCLFCLFALLSSLTKVNPCSYALNILHFNKCCCHSMKSVRLFLFLHLSLKDSGPLVMDTVSEMDLLGKFVKESARKRSVMTVSTPEYVPCPMVIGDYHAPSGVSSPSFPSLKSAQF